MGESDKRFTAAEVVGWERHPSSFIYGFLAVVWIPSGGCVAVEDWCQANLLYL